MRLFLDRATRSDIARATVTDKLANRQARRDRRVTRRDTRKERRSTRRATRRSAIRSFVAQLPARLILVPVVIAAGAAWRGQEDWALTGLRWSFLWAAGLATALETLGFAAGAMARSARNDNDSALIERLFMWAVVGSAAYLNWTHSNEPVLGIMSIAGVAGWELYERRRHRHAMNAARPEPLPRFGIARWVRFTAWTFKAWSVSVRDRLSTGDALVALQRADTEKRSSAIATRSRRSWVPQVREYIDTERQQASERYERVLQEGHARLGAAALLLGPDTLRATSGTVTPEVAPAQVAPPATPKRRMWRKAATEAATPPPPEELTAPVVDVPEPASAEAPEQAPAPSPTVLSFADAGTKKAAMLAVFNSYVAAGKLHELNGSKLAREAGASLSFGRRFFPEWERAALNSDHNDEEAVK